MSGCEKRGVAIGGDGIYESFALGRYFKLVGNGAAGEAAGEAQYPMNSVSSVLLTGRRVEASIHRWEMIPFMEGVVPL